MLSPEGELYAATSDGIYAVGDYDRLRKLTEVAAYSLTFADGTDILMGAMDGIYRYSTRTRQVGRVSGIEKVVHLEVKKIILYGQNHVWRNLSAERRWNFVLQPRETKK